MLKKVVFFKNENYSKEGYVNTQRGLICKFYYKDNHSGSLNISDSSETHNHYNATNSEDMVEFNFFLIFYSITVSKAFDLARIENVLVEYKKKDITTGVDEQKGHTGLSQNEKATMSVINKVQYNSPERSLCQHSPRA